MEERIELGAFDTRKGGEQGRVITLKAPSGVLLPGFRVRGYDSDTYQAKWREKNRERLERGRRGRKPTPEEIEADALEVASVLLSDWPDKFNLDGQAFPYTPANAATFITRFPWAREQVEEAAGERADFLPGSAKS